MMVRVPEVLNKLIDVVPPGTVYVGRPSKWGNPFRIGVDGDREEVIAKYLEYLLGTEHTTGLVLDIGELRDRDLVCFCAPLPCHADVLLELANR